MIRDLADLLLRLNHLVDCDFDEDVTPEEVDEHLEKGDVFRWLESKFSGHFKMPRSNRDTVGAISRELKAIRQVAKAREAFPHPRDQRRVSDWLRSPSSIRDNPVSSKPFEWEPHHNGICVLISCAVQAIQQHEAALPAHRVRQ